MVKKISRKAPLLLAVCLAFALILAGCGGSGSPASDQPTGSCGCRDEECILFAQDPDYNCAEWCAVDTTCGCNC